MPETTPLIKAALNLRVGAGFDVYKLPLFYCSKSFKPLTYRKHSIGTYYCVTLFTVE